MIIIHSILASSNRSPKSDNTERYSLSAHEKLMKNYGSSRLTQPIVDRAYRCLLDASKKRDDLKRRLKSDQADSLGFEGKF